jgi:DNA-binding PadR family transcriptional regulator
MPKHRHAHLESRQASGAVRSASPHRSGRPDHILDYGELRYVLLRLIAERPRHGYELIKAIEDMSSRTYRPSPGVIYPSLTLLEQVGYLQAKAGGGTKKLYSITEEGAAFLNSHRAVVDAIDARMVEARRADGGGPAPEIRRAMHNLELALFIRLDREPLDVNQVRAIVDVLDRVAGEIERS